MSTAEKLYEAITAFQNSLPDSSDVAVALANFGVSTTIMINSIGYIGSNLIVFRRADNSGNPLELIQHVNQLDFLLTVVSKPVPEVLKRQIGFDCK